MEKYRLCVVGFAHMHVNGLIDSFLATGRVELVACADTIPATPSLARVAGSRAANLARALAGPDRPRAYADWRHMLRQERLDLAIFCPEIAGHAEVAEALAARGLHMVTEKPLAGTLADARRILHAVQSAGVRLAVNWPTSWQPHLRAIPAVLAAGAIGTVVKFAWRNRASLGPLAPGSRHPGDTVVDGALTPAELAAEWWYRKAEGGGALLDYCCYGACLSTWLLGQPPRAVQAIAANLASPWGDAEDNAVLLLRYPAAIAILEASWTTAHPGVPNGPVITGTAGTLVAEADRLTLHRPDAAQIIPAAALPPGQASIGEAFLHHLETGTPLHPTLDAALNLQVVAILDAGARAAASGQAVPVAGTAPPGGRS